MEAGDNSSLQIFKAIGDLMTASDFITANTQFFEVNCQMFEESVEENKHEYK